MEQQFCAALECECPIDMEALPNTVYVGHTLRFCHVCFEMFINAMRPWFMDAQAEWNRERMKRKRLMPGSNYFND